MFEMNVARGERKLTTDRAGFVSLTRDGTDAYGYPAPDQRWPSGTVTRILNTFGFGDDKVDHSIQFLIRVIIELPPRDPLLALRAAIDLIVTMWCVRRSETEHDKSDLLKLK
jgi:hypothetical protein